MTEELKDYISRLIALYEKQKERVAFLSETLENKESQIARYKEELEKYKAQISDLTLQIEDFRLRSAFVSGDNKAEAVKGINALIKEIDECIRLLSD